jgi:hypothetical protein
MTFLYDKGVTMSNQQVFRQGPVKITRAVIDAAWKKLAPGHRTILNDVDCRGLTPADDGRRLTLNLSAKPGIVKRGQTLIPVGGKLGVTSHCIVNHFMIRSSIFNNLYENSHKGKYFWG